MIDFTALRHRLSGHGAADQSRSAEGQPDPSSGAQLPFPDYDDLGEKQLIAGLSDHSQLELDAAETYERSHENRLAVLDKLRYMRGSEPLPGYDALEVEEIVAALTEADLPTIKKVRAYERKFANRPAVLEEVVRVLHRRQAATPAAPASKYQPLGATSGSNGRRHNGMRVGARP